MFALFCPDCWCGRSCGQRYWGDFYSDPPDCWDPCDCNGNYTGGCRSCGGGGYGMPNGYSQGYPINGNVSGGMLTGGGNIISQTDRTMGPNPMSTTEPHPAAKPQ